MLRKVLFVFVLFNSIFACANGTLVIVVGTGGESEYQKSFAQWADRWMIAGKNGGLSVLQIGRDDSSQTATAPTATTSPSSDKQLIQSILEKEASEQKSPIWMVLIGHGAPDGREIKFNLRGPDLSDKELSDWLKKMHRPIAIINCFSSSGPFLNRLTGPDRVVITATKTGSEFQYSRFGDYLSASITDPSADLDKDGQTSLLEAFLAASHRTEEFYILNGRLATEHPLLDDNADGLGVSADWFQGTRAVRSARTGAPVDGPLAGQWIMVPSPSEQSLRPELRARRNELEREIELLRQKKTSLDEVEYYSKLEIVLVEMARLYEINDKQNKE